MPERGPRAGTYSTMRGATSAPILQGTSRRSWWTGIATLYGTVRSTRDRRRQAEIVKELAGPLIEVAGAHRLWRIPATVRAKLQAERLIAEVQRPPTEGAEEEEPARETLADDRPVD